MSRAFGLIEKQIARANDSKVHEEYVFENI